MHSKRLLFAVLTCFLAAKAAALDGREHEQLSDLAFLIALGKWGEDQQRAADHDGRSAKLLKQCSGQSRSVDHLCCMLATADGLSNVVSLVRACDDFRQRQLPMGPMRDPLQDDPIKAITYGGAVRLVDEMLFPDRLFVPEGVPGDPPPCGGSAGSQYPTCFRELNQRYHLRWEARAKAGKTVNAVFEGYRALANNDMHFQNDLLHQLERFWREANITIEQYAYYALLSNALSDHFFQDFLAPGHILWPRNHAHDNAAIALHDGTNQKGAWLALDSDYWDSESVMNIFDFLTRHVGSDSSKAYLGSDYVGALEREWLRRKPGSLIAMPTCAVDDADCAESDEPGNIAQGLRILALAILPEGVPPELMADGGLTTLSESAVKPAHLVYLYGDGLVSKSPAQQAMLVLVQAERIHSLLTIASGGGGKPRELVPAQPIFSFNNDFSDLIVPETGLWFGSYRFICDGCGGEFKDSDDVFKGTASSLYLFHGGGQSPFRSVGSARYQLSTEVVPLGLMSNVDTIRNAAVQKPPKYCNFLSACNSALAFSVDYVHDGEFTAPGVGVRVIKALPGINMQVSPYLKYLNYRFDQQNDWNISYGLRADWGFGLGSLYLTLGKEYFINDSRSLESTGMISFGIGVGISHARLRKWLFQNRTYLQPKPEKPLRVPASLSETNPQTTVSSAP